MFATPLGTGPPDVGEALTELDAMLRGDFGELWYHASWCATDWLGHPLGLIHTARESPWHTPPAGPHVIEVYVDGGARGRGVGTALLRRAAAGCHVLGEEHLTVRADPGEHPDAVRLFERIGFQAWEPALA